MISGAALGVGGGAAYSMLHLFGRNSVIADSLLGPLQVDPAGVIDLPQGFSYQIIDRHRQRMDDGFLVPGRPDGMACFTSANGSWCLMRNHELSGLTYEAEYLGGKTVSAAYRPDFYGAVTRIEVDPKSLRRLRSNLVLTGTDRNCAGGWSPWGWLSCEESLVLDHGFVFLCSHEARQLQPPHIIEPYGRCRHEAATVDPQTNIAYLTEDEPDSCLYRFVPDNFAKPWLGTLQAMAVVQQPAVDLGQGQLLNARLSIRWVNVNDDVLARRTPLRHQARIAGAALIRRGEGLWLAGRELYFSSTNGGPVGAGQVFRLNLDEPQHLVLVAQSESRSHLDMPDNLTLSPRGGLYLAEDGLGAQFIRGVTPRGGLFDLAQNAISNSEFAGICFSPDGRVLFANLQEDGITLAIEGPFPI